MSSSPIEEVLARYTPQWVAIDGVVGTAIGLHQGKPCILIFVAKRTRALDDKIPPVVEGYRIVIEETGRFRALRSDRS